MKEVKFIQMKDGDKEDYDFLINHEIEHTKGTADRLIKALVELDEGLSGYKITRLGHSLQSATRAWRDVLGMEHGNSMKGVEGEKAVIEAYQFSDDF